MLIAGSDHGSSGISNGHMRGLTLFLWHSRMARGGGELCAYDGWPRVGAESQPGVSDCQRRGGEHGWAEPRLSAGPGNRNQHFISGKHMVSRLSVPTARRSQVLRNGQWPVSKETPLIKAQGCVSPSEVSYLGEGGGLCIFNERVLQQFSVYFVLL